MPLRRSDGLLLAIPKPQNDAIVVVMGGELDFQRLFEESPDVLLVLLPDAPRFTMVAATRARLEATLLTREQTLGHGLFEVFPDNPEEAGATGSNNLRASLGRVLSTRAADTMAVQKYDIRGPSGEFVTRYWSPRNIPVLSDSGEVAYILHRVEDVTELIHQSELGQELRDRSQAMEREVVKRSRELHAANLNLREANHKLGELDAAKTAFFSNVSHEFRTPLTLMLGPLEDALAKPSGAPGREDLAAMHRNALRLLRMVNTLLDFSRIEAGRLQSLFQATDLARLTAALAGSFHSLVTGAGLQLRIDCPPLPEAVYVDTAHWEKIVLNLISNAFKFTFEGSLEVTLRSNGDQVELSVQDTGTGIPASELPLIFDRFHRVEGARGRSFEGTGIGLALVKELAQLHGGSVRVASEVGRGSCFTVSIPKGFAHLDPARIGVPESKEREDVGASPSVVSAKRQVKDLDLAPDELPEAPVGKAGGARILLADDNTDMREYLRRLLEPHWNVEAVSNGKQALDSAQRRPPDLLISDVMMPEMNGAELLKALRSDERTRTTPVVLLSARAGEEAVLSGLDGGADDYLVKPFSARQLLSRVRSLLEMARIRREAGEVTARLAEARALLVEELEAKNKDLASAYRELQATQAQLVQSAKMASLGELVAGVAHEINNPLAFTLSHLDTVKRSLETLQEGRHVALPEDAASHFRRATDRLREMHLGLGRIRDLVIKLRTFSRLDEGEVKMTSVKDNVASVLTILHHRFADGLEVVTRFCELDWIECYPGPLNQALLNLVANAIDAVDGAGTITIATEVQADRFIIAISDTGVGIPEAIRERVFEPFFTTKAVGHGTGLGLSITYAIATKHGGTLELRPAVGGGTVAQLSLPLKLPS